MLNITTTPENSIFPSSKFLCSTSYKVGRVVLSFSVGLFQSVCFWTQAFCVCLSSLFIFIAKLYSFVCGSTTKIVDQQPSMPSCIGPLQKIDSIIMFYKPGIYKGRKIFYDRGQTGGTTESYHFSVSKLDWSDYLHGWTEALCLKHETEGFWITQEVDLEI